MKPIIIVIEDISEGNMKGFSATMHGINDSIAFGDNFEELFKGVVMTFDMAKEDGSGVFADQKEHPQKDIKIKLLGLNKIKAKSI